MTPYIWYGIALKEIFMNREFYINLAKNGLKMPYGLDLELHKEKDPEQIKLDGNRLGPIIERTALKYNTPLAIPLMDLKIEQQAIFLFLGINPEEVDKYHFTKAPEDFVFQNFLKNINNFYTPRMQATCDALKYISNNTNLLCIAKCIGPFSLMTILIHDPITSVYMYGMGMNENDDPSILLLTRVFEMATKFLIHYINEQIKAGAKAILICEPAANKVYISPKQIDSGSNIWEKTVLKYNLTIKHFIQEKDCDLIFHNCGELTNKMVESFNKLDPAILSLGSSRKLWEDALLISKNTVLFGNLPTKLFYNDKDMPKAKVIELSIELKEKMKKINHPFILGSECDVLSVKGFNDKINVKINAFLTCNCQSPGQHR